MTTLNSPLCETLNRLLRVCQDGKDGFYKAAALVKGVELTSLFIDCAQAHARLIGELQAMIGELEGTPDGTGSAVASLHRGWMRLRAMAALGDDLAVIHECLRGEDATLHAYETAWQPEWPIGVRMLLQDQHQRVQQVYSSILALVPAASPVGS